MAIALIPYLPNEKNVDQLIASGEISNIWTQLITCMSLFMEDIKFICPLYAEKEDWHYLHYLMDKMIEEIYATEPENIERGSRIYELAVYALEDEEFPYRGGDMNKKITHPEYYSQIQIEPLDFILANELDFICGNNIKYICRYKEKGGIEDLQKARFYLDLQIQKEGLAGDDNGLHI